MERVYPCYLWVKFFADEDFEIGLMRNKDYVWLVGEDEEARIDDFAEIGDVIEVPERYRRHD